MRESQLESTADTTPSAANLSHASSTSSGDPQMPAGKRNKASRTVETRPADVPADVSAEVSAETTQIEDATIHAARRAELIRHAAYRRFEARGGDHGHHDEDWAEAEREVDGIMGST